MSHRKYSLFIEKDTISISKYIQDDEEIADNIDTLKRIKEIALEQLDIIYNNNKKYIESLTEKDFK